MIRIVLITVLAVVSLAACSGATRIALPVAYEVMS